MSFIDLKKIEKLEREIEGYKAWIESKELIILNLDKHIERLKKKLEQNETRIT